MAKVLCMSLRLGSCQQTIPTSLYSEFEDWAFHLLSLLSIILQDVEVRQSSMPEGEVKRAGGDKGGSFSRWLDSTIQVSTFGNG